MIILLIISIKIQIIDIVGIIILITNILEEFVLNLRRSCVILAPGTSEVGLGAAALAPLPPDQRDPRASSGRPLFVRRHHT